MVYQAKFFKAFFLIALLFWTFTNSSILVIKHCPANEVFITNHNMCLKTCPSNYFTLSKICVRYITCPAGQVLNTFTNACCSFGQTFNIHTNVCCPQNTACPGCVTGTIFISGANYCLGKNQMVLFIPSAFKLAYQCSPISIINGVFPAVYCPIIVSPTQFLNIQTGGSVSASGAVSFVAVNSEGIKYFFTGMLENKQIKGIIISGFGQTFQLSINVGS